MAKTESTAVNELIELVQNKRVAPAEPAADLFSASAPATRSTRVTPPRTIAPVPPIPAVAEVAPLPPSRAPHATSQQRVAPPPAVRMSTADPDLARTIPPLSAPSAAPPPSPHVRVSQQVSAVAQPREHSDVTPLPLPRTDDSPLPVAWSTSPPATAPVAAPFDAPSRRAPAAPREPVVARSVPQPVSWFDSGRLKKADRTEGTAIVSRQDGDGLLKKLIVPMILAICIGVAVGGYLAMNVRDGKKTQDGIAVAGVPSPDTRVAMPVSPAEEPAPAAQAEPAGVPADSDSIVPAATAAALAGNEVAPVPAPAVDAQPEAASGDAVAAAPAVREVQTVRGVVKLVDVRIDSDPPGATVMLVDGGKTSFLGSTPLATSLDPSRAYDVIFSLPGRPTKMVSLDPASTSRLDVTLGRAKAERAAKRKSRGSSDRSLAAAVEAPSEKQAASAEKAVAETKAEPVGEGTLMVNSKPPCEILIDGKPTGLTTPQRSITLPAGRHEITFVNASAGIRKTVSVKITAGQVTRLIQDLMNQ